MLLELVIATMVFVVMITTIMGWQCGVITSFARLKGRVALLHCITDGELSTCDKVYAAGKYRITCAQQKLELDQEGCKNIEALLGVVPAHEWHYTRAELSMKNAAGQGQVVRVQ